MTQVPTDKTPRRGSATGTPVTSIYGLALETGVSPSTVSRVLNQRGRISEDTRRRVLDAARAAGFRPQASARRSTAAIVLDRMRYAGCGGFLASILSHLIAAMARHDVVAEIYSEDNVDQLSTRFIDGVLALTWDTRTIDLLKGIGDVPVVLINRGDVEGVSVAMTDHRAGGRTVAEYLLERGHRHLAVLAEEHDWGNAERIVGVNDALRHRGLDPSKCLTTAFTNHHSMGAHLEQVLAGKTTALFLAGEDLTYPAIHAIGDTFGRKVGRDISVVGMENELLSSYSTAPPTSLAQPMPDLAEAALELLLAGVSKSPSEPGRRVLHNRLIERDTVANLAADPR
jgi:DNA-binding LacI/PurR family transcriptional regulator